MQRKLRNHMVYSKHKDDKRFLPMDIKRGVQVHGLLYASIIYPENFQKVKEFVDALNAGGGDFIFEIRPIRAK